MLLGVAIRKQSQQINKILKNVNAAMMNHASKAVDIGEKAIVEYGYYRYHICTCNFFVVTEIKDYYLHHIIAPVLHLFGKLDCVFTNTVLNTEHNFTSEDIISCHFVTFKHLNRTHLNVQTLISLNNSV